MDPDGDTLMGGVNALKLLQAAISTLTAGPSSQKKVRPLARWICPEEFERLRSEGICIRCRKFGHKSRVCPEFGPAKRPAAISHIGNSVQRQVIKSQSEVEA